MSYALATYQADGATAEFTVPFPYLDQNHVRVRVNGAAPALPPAFNASGFVRVVPTPPVGSVIELRRVTPRTPLVAYNDGAVLTSEDLNTATLQLIYLFQELDDQYNDLINPRLIAAAGGDLGIVTDPEAILSEVANLVLETEVLDRFRESIADIALNAEAIINEALARYDNVNKLGRVELETRATGNALVQERLARLQLSLDLTEVQAFLAPGGALATTILNLQTAINAGGTTLVETLALIGAKSPDGLSFILDVNKVKVSPTESLAARLSAISASFGEVEALILDEATLRSNADGALASRLSVTEAVAAGAVSAITTEATARASADGAITTRIDALVASITTGGAATSAEVVAEATARAEADTAIGTRINTVQAQLDSDVALVNALVATKETASVTRDEAIGTRIDTVEASLSTDLGALNAFVNSENTARANAISALASHVDAVQTTLYNEDGATRATVGAVNTAAVSRDNALGVRVDDVVASVATEVGLRAAAVTAEATARASAIDAEAAARTSLAAVVAGNTSAITSEANTRATADSTIASNLTLLTTRVGTAETSILSEASARTSADTALGTRVDGLLSRVGSSEAAIVSEASTRASADTANATAIGVVSSTVGTNTAAVATLSASVNGIAAKYGVSLDVNGFVSGFVQNNSGSSSDFTILANRFAIVDPGAGPGATPTVPFEVSGGVVRIKEAAIGTLKVGKLISDTTKVNADFDFGTGKIIFNNGAVMKVIGVGFGSSSQFIEWFGPTQASLTTCTEANAISFLKTNGDAYFGGSLSAGVLKTALTTSDLSATASGTIGPYGSNGRTIQVVASYSAYSEQTLSYPATVAGQNSWNAYIAAWGTSANSEGYADASKGVSATATAALERDVGAGYSQVAALSVTAGTEALVGQRPSAVDVQAGYITLRRTLGGSITYTDPTLSTINRAYRLSLTARSASVMPYSVGQSQRLSLTSTEG